MKSHDLEFEKLIISKSICLAFHCFNSTFGIVIEKQNYDLYI
jgi:hypothetical protein